MWLQCVDITEACLRGGVSNPACAHAPLSKSAGFRVTPKYRPLLRVISNAGADPAASGVPQEGAVYQSLSQLVGDLPCTKLRDMLHDMVFITYAIVSVSAAHP